MASLIRYEIDGKEFFVEGEDAGDSPLPHAGSSAIRGGLLGDATETSPLAAQAGGHFQDAIAHIRPAAEAVLHALAEMNQPDEINLEFGVKFSAKVGAILASADSEATFKVSLKWKNE
jgi:hypothetical protein